MRYLAIFSMICSATFHCVAFAQERPKTIARTAAFVHGRDVEAARGFDKLLRVNGFNVELIDMTEIERANSEREEYGSRVVEHFSGTSELMRDLTVQYRAVYDQLTQGATSLCPEGSVGLQDGLQPEMLDEGRREEGEGEAPAVGAAPEE